MDRKFVTTQITKRHEVVRVALSNQQALNRVLHNFLRDHLELARLQRQMLQMVLHEFKHDLRLRKVTATLRGITVTAFRQPVLMNCKDAGIDRHHAQGISLFINDNLLKAWCVFKPDQTLNGNGLKIIFVS